jgi:ubiquitin fusion degradation protein 1
MSYGNPNFPGFGGGGFGMPGFGRSPGTGRFEQTFRAFPFVFINKQQFEEGGKIILPPSALDRLTHMNIQYPMLFELSNPQKKDRKVHAGVIEFVAEEGMCYLPFWMMQNLGLTEGSFISVKSTSLPQGSFVKLQPHSKTFLDISNPRAVLERALRYFSALTKGETIALHYNDKIYAINVLEVKPESAHGGISIVETDINVDFAPPLDYVEPQKPEPPQPVPMSSTPPTTPAIGAGPGTGTPAGTGAGTAAAKPAEPAFVPFAGSGYSLTGKPAPSASLAVPGKGAPAKTPSPASTPPSAPRLGTSPTPPGIPSAVPAKGGGLIFGGSTPAAAAKPAPKPAEAKPEPKQEKPGFVPFSGAGYSLRK